MPELDSVRGLAVLGVLLYHGLYWSRDFSEYRPWQQNFLHLFSVGQFGVNLFFVLSGLLITRILLDSRDRLDYYGRFYWRRALRILPAYFATMLVLVLFGLTSRQFFFMSMVYCSNLSLLFGIAMSYPVLWSLAVEEHFYFLWPAVVKRVSPRQLAWVAGLILVLSPASRFMCHLHAASMNFGCSYYTWNTADGLALGALLALLIRRLGNNRIRLSQCCLGLFIAGFLIALTGYPFGITTRTNALGEALQWVPWNLGFGGLISAFLLVGSSDWRGWVTPRILVFLGKISYGLYLYHLMFFGLYHWIAKHTGFEGRLQLSPWGRVCAGMILAGGMSIVVSYASRRYLEEPFLRLKDRFSGRGSVGRPSNWQGTDIESSSVAVQVQEHRVEKTPGF